MKFMQAQTPLFILLVVHSIISLAAYKFLTTTTKREVPVDSTPVDVSTPEQKAKHITNLRIGLKTETSTYEVPVALPFYVTAGYLGLGAAFLYALYYRLQYP